MTFISSILGTKKRNPIVEAAFCGIERVLNQLTTQGDTVCQPPNVWEYMTGINDPGSPRRMVISSEGESCQKLLVYYPKNSTPYEDPVREKYKYCEIEAGSIKDMISGKVYKKGDALLVRPHEAFSPVTGPQNECWAVVELRDRP